VACSSSGDWAVVEMLLTRYPEGVDCIDSDRDYPLHRAVVNYTSAAPLIVEKLLGLRPGAASIAGSNGEYPLHKAVAASPYLDVVCKVLRAYPEGISVPAMAGPFLSDWPAHRAACNKSDAAIQIVGKILSECPAAADVKGFLGRTPLHIACSETRSISVVEELLCWSQDDHEGMLVSDQEGDTPLHRAMYNQSEGCQLDIVKLILAHSGGAAASSRGHDGALPLHTACAHASSGEVVKCLLDHDVPTKECDCQRALELCQNHYGKSSMPWQLLSGIKVLSPKTKCGLGVMAHLDAALKGHAVTRGRPNVAGPQLLPWRVDHPPG